MFITHVSYIIIRVVSYRDVIGLACMKKFVCDCFKYLCHLRANIYSKIYLCCPFTLYMGTVMSEAGIEGMVK